MKHLVIRNVGPIKDLDIELRRVNLLIGEQSSGKSTINKIACHCSWVEKEISIAQSSVFFQKTGVFESRLIEFHKLECFINSDTYIEYETDVMFFYFSKKEELFHFQWKNRWEYMRPKTIYIPAERNIVATIPNWFDVKLKENNIRSFMSDWEEARTYYSGKPTKILNLGVQYTFDSDNRKDTVKVSDNRTLDFTNVSSGLQSLVPLWVLLKYVTEGVYREEKKDSVSIASINKQLTDNIYKEIIRPYVEKGNFITRLTDNSFQKTVGTQQFLFADKDSAEQFESVAHNFIYPHYTNVFLEEPEENLYPITQKDLVLQIVSLLNGKRPHNLFITTHSPYILTTFNNLLYASELGKKKRDQVKKIIPMKYWVQYENMGAWFVKKGTVTSIMDRKLKQIGAEKIDEVSRHLNKDFDKLLDLEYETE